MSRYIQQLSDQPWHLWCDRDAAWRDDPLYLPDQVIIEKMPSNPPTIGWQRLFDKHGIEQDVVDTMLPATVEQFFWGKFGLRSYNNEEYDFVEKDPVVQNGNYHGVSWWWRKFSIPNDQTGKQIKINFRGARLRAEIYLNRKLVGYNLIHETPFSVDISKDVRFDSENELAIRITNPGGRLDWCDFSSDDLQGILYCPPLMWGEYKLPMSHGFGGLDSGIYLSSTDHVWIEDIFVKNKPQMREVTNQITIFSGIEETIKIDLGILIFPKNQPENIVWQHKATNVTLSPGLSTISYPAFVPEALLWSPDQPNLYTVQVCISCDHAADTLTKDFGFRWFEVRGLGTKAHFYLNNKRSVLRSAISWGFWPLSGLFPTPEFIEKEIQAAKSIGLNMLNFHRNLGNPLVLDECDKEGLFRYEEPGDGRSCQDENDFSRSYSTEKIRRMVIRDRSHPSLIMYVLMNEIIDLPPTHPRYREIMHTIHSLDPSRIVVLKSAFSDGAQVPPFSLCAYGESYYLPYDDSYYYDDGSHWCGWWDQHTVAGPGVYRDNLYNNPGDFSHRSENVSEIVVWGETLGSGSPDNLEAIQEYFDVHSDQGGYTKIDHQELFNVYQEFLDRWNFRPSFPTVQSLTQSVGDRTYYFWGRIVENGRICDPIDAMIISGWESNPIENHCGLVDIFRNLKGDPSLISYYTRPVHLAIKSRHLVVHVGQPVVTDFFLVNELDLKGRARIEYQVLDDHGMILFSDHFEAEINGADVYGQLIKEAVVTDCYPKRGYYTIEASLFIKDEKKVSGKEQIFVVEWENLQLPKNGAILESKNHLNNFLSDRKHTNYQKFTSDIKDIDFLIIGDQHPARITLSDEILDRVKAGLRLILVADDRSVAQSWCEQLAQKRVIEFKGMVGEGRASYMGCWYFVKDHPIFDSLPVNTAFSWEYQADPRGTRGEWFAGADLYGGDGMMIEGNNVEYVVGYSRDHDRNIGASLAVIKHGNGSIIINSIAGLYSSLSEDHGVHPEVARRIICNFITGYASNVNPK